MGDPDLAGDRVAGFQIVGCVEVGPKNERLERACTRIARRDFEFVHQAVGVVLELDRVADPSGAAVEQNETAVQRPRPLSANVT